MRPEGASSHQPRVTPWGTRVTSQAAPRQGKSLIVGRKMLLLLQSEIITRHITPRALPWANWLLALQAVLPHSCIRIQQLETQFIKMTLEASALNNRGCEVPPESADKDGTTLDIKEASDKVASQ